MHNETVNNGGIHINKLLGKLVNNLCKPLHIAPERTCIVFYFSFQRTLVSLNRVNHPGCLVQNENNMLLVYFNLCYLSLHFSLQVPKLVNQFIHLSKTNINTMKTLVHLVEPLVHLVEPLIYLVETPVNMFKTRVHAFQRAGLAGMDSSIHFFAQYPTQSLFAGTNFLSEQ